MRSTVEVGVACGSHTASLVPKAEDWLTIASVNFHMSHDQQRHKQPSETCIHNNTIVVHASPTIT